jgi:hypothetical protein
MGEASRRVREVKDPLRFRRANVERFTREVAMLAAAYHKTREVLDEHTAALEAAVAKLTADGHPFYAAPDAPETAIAPEAAASEDQTP